jgi:hypothetical protein
MLKTGQAELIRTVRACRGRGPMKSKSYLMCLCSIAALSLTIPCGSAKDKKAKTAEDPKDEIQVLGHVDVSGGAIANFLITPHYSSLYLYAERGAGKPVTLVDVSKPAKPLVLGDMSYAGNSGLTLVAGTAALVGTGPAPAAQAPSNAPQTMRIMDFSDPKNPKVAREFTGVTAIARDDKRGLVFLADANGIWILQQKLALDPAVEKAYSDYVFYSH